MATQRKLRRGTDAQMALFTGAVDEITFNSTTRRLHWHDGATAGGDAITPTVEDIQSHALDYGAAVSGASPDDGDTLLLTLSPPIIAYTDGLTVRWKQNANNTGAVTLDVNGKGARSVKKNAGADELAADDLVAGGQYAATLIGTTFQLHGTGGAGGGELGTLIASASASASASLDFTTGIDSNYEVYCLVLSRILPASGDRSLWLRVSDDGGSTFESSGYAYSVSGVRNGGATSVINTAQSQIDLLGNPGANSGVGTVTNAGGLSGLIYLHGFAASGNEHKVNFQVTWWEQLDQPAHMSGGGYFVGNTNALDGIQVLFESGNIATGEAYLYGVVSA